MREITVAKEKGTETKTNTELLNPAKLSDKGLKGVYKGSKTFSTKFGTLTVHTIGDKRVKGATDLDRKLELVSEGTEVLIKFAGTVKTKRGFNFNTFTVMVDD